MVGVALDEVSGLGWASRLLHRWGLAPKRCIVVSSGLPGRLTLYPDPVRFRVAEAHGALTGGELESEQRGHRTREQFVRSIEKSLTFAGCRRRPISARIFDSLLQHVPNHPVYSLSNPRGLHSRGTAGKTRTVTCYPDTAEKAISFVCLARAINSISCYQ